MPSLFAQSSRSSTPGGRKSTPPPRDRPGPLDSSARPAKRRLGKADIYEKHANGLRESFRRSLVGTGDDLEGNL